MAVVALTGCGTASPHVSAPQVPQRPTLPTKATQDSVLQFGCPARQVSTVDIEACEVRDELRLNARFNAATAALWPLLDKTAKRDFADSQRAWSRLLRDECDIASREFLGGSAAPIAGGSCFVSLTRARVRDVKGLLAEYCQGKVRTGPARLCPRQ